MDIQQIIAILIFILVMIAIISEKVNRAVAAMAGGLLMVLYGVISLEASITHIDFNTIGVLIGMMLFVSIVKNSGLFEYIAILSAKKSGGDPWKIMLCFIIITSLL